MNRSAVIAPSPQHTPENEQGHREGWNEVEITKIQWKFFHETLFEHDLQTESVNKIMEKTGRRPLR